MRCRKVLRVTDRLKSTVILLSLWFLLKTSQINALIKCTQDNITKAKGKT